MNKASCACWISLSSYKKRSICHANVITRRQHWQLWRISRLAKVGNGSTPSSVNPNFCTNGNYPTIACLEREIQFLREYRTRLVADVVTDKLDVRKAAAALPHDALPSAIELNALDVNDDSDAADELDDPQETETGATGWLS